MIGFSIFELLIVLISALIYGAVYSIFCLFIDVLLYVFTQFHKFIPAAFSTEKKALTDVKKSLSEGAASVSPSSATVFLKILVFSVGIILISYCLMDGLARLFLFAFAALTFAVTRSCLKSTARPLAYFAVLNIAFAFFTILRWILYPILFFVRIIAGFLHKMYKKVALRHIHSLDKTHI